MERIVILGLAAASIAFFGISTQRTEQDLKQQVQDLKGQIDSVTKAVKDLDEDRRKLRDQLGEMLARNERTEQRIQNFESATNQLDRELRRIGYTPKKKAGIANEELWASIKPAGAGPDAPLVKLGKALGWMDKRVASAEKKLKLKTPPKTWKD
jgi:TolA-binding protein